MVVVTPLSRRSLDWRLDIASRHAPINAHRQLRLTRDVVGSSPIAPNELHHAHIPRPRARDASSGRQTCALRTDILPLHDHLKARIPAYGTSVSEPPSPAAPRRLLPHPPTYVYIPRGRRGHSPAPLRGIVKGGERGSARQPSISSESPENVSGVSWVQAAAVRGPGDGVISPSAASYSPSDPRRAYASKPGPFSAGGEARAL